MIKNIEKIVNVSEFDSIQISLASPERIREISYGEVKKPETINYRSLRPERDGLFCEKIFGTTKEWECYCGKFKSFRYKGVVCDRCGVEVEHFKVRRQRMGHIELAAPVAHIWYYKSVPSRIGLLLGYSIKDLKSIIYFEKYVVIESTDTELKEKQLLTEYEYLEYKKEYGVNFTAEMGALAIKLLLQKLNLDEEEESLRLEMNERGNKTDVRLLKRLELIKDIKRSCNRPEWMILDVLPVIPPELRPMVQLDTGRFATSDLNDLYRRVINRNNRLKRLQLLKAPDIIIRNEKRMLQESVDSLFDNSKRKKMVKGAGNRPLKSIADMLKGKQGRFRQNLLGKRVDYSGRTVIVVGPNLKLHQCGLPKKMALELFKPFVMRHLVEKEIVYNIKGAKNIIEKESPEVWGVLEEIIKGHPVLLNRAPTLHRLGIQAFEPILIDGGAIQLHPLVCHAFNADFDGDQMAVHIPLSIEAQVECWFLMLSSNNILNPANGESIVTPTQDIVLGIYLLTKENTKFTFKNKVFSSFDEIKLAHSTGYIHLQEKIRVYSEIHNKIIETTYGRIIFNMAFDNKIEFINEVITDQVLAKLILKIFHTLGHHETVKIIDRIKDIGFEYATNFSLSIGLNDIAVPVEKEDLIRAGDEKVNKITENYNNGYITEDERVNQVIDVWTRVGDQISEKMMQQLEKDQNGFNPLHIMAKSGARGSRQQIRQLAGMRGLMVKPSGDILELPIKSNFKEGLDVLEYFISTHGARKGLADTAIKTADAGYLTRRLVDIAQDVVITQYDCKTINGVSIDLSSQFLEDEDEILLNRIYGRFVLEDIYDFETGEKIIGFMEEINLDIGRKILRSNIQTIRIRSVITCELRFGICSICYGRNLANGRIVELGESVGVIAAQSIGQPGTQLTMRTFHIGGTAAREIEDKNVTFDFPIYIKSIPVNISSYDEENKKNINIIIRKGDLVYYKVLAVYDISDFSKIIASEEARVNVDDIIGLNLNGQNILSPSLGIFKILGNHVFIYHRLETRYTLKNGTKLYIKVDDFVPKGVLVGEFDPYNEPIFARKSGIIKFIDIIEGSTLRIEDNKDTGIKDQIIMDVRDINLTPKVMIVDDTGEPISTINIPGGAYLLVHESDRVIAGTIIAKITRAQTKTKDITGGLPRISELFEARKPKDVCILAEQEGIIHFGEKHKGKVVINIEYNQINSEGVLEKKYAKHIIPSGKSILALDLDYVKAGDKICDGQVNPHDILRIQSIEKLQEYLINEIQGVYRLQGVHINDKHVGIIIRQMLRKLEIIEPGDTDFIVGQQVDKFLFHDKNEKIVEHGGKAATARPILQGITRASLNIDSFISAASFQETTKVLTNAAIRSSVDYLRGLKENVIIGHLIPAGTGMKDKFQRSLDEELEKEELDLKIS